MAREDIKLTIQLLHIHRHVGYRLGTVHQDRHIMFVGNADDLLNRIDRTQHIGYMSHRHQTSPFGKELLVGIQLELSPLIHRNHLEGNSLAGRLNLPGDDVGMVLHDRDDHLITGRHTGIRKTGGD